MPRILVADDEDDIRLLIKILLVRSGFEVAEAHDGLEALEMATASPPDLILLDIRMPKMTGLEALDRLKAEPATAGVPVLMVSAYAQEGDVGQGLARGAVSYVTKPFQPQELLAKVKSLLSGSPPP